MTIVDQGVTAKDAYNAVVLLKNARGRTIPLDRAVDAAPRRRVAHVAEEALRRFAMGHGLWRFTGEDAGLITAAVAWLNSSQFRNAPEARRGVRAEDGGKDRRPC